MFRTLLLSVSVMLVSGCAFTVHDVNLNYRYDKPISADLSAFNLNVGEFHDSRGVTNPRMIMNMTNLNGNTTSGGWQAEKPLSEILKDAVIIGLSKANADLNDTSSDLVLTGELLGYDGEVIMGAWEGTFKGQITAKLQLKNKLDGTIVWRDTFIGSGQVKGGKGAVGALRVSLDNLISVLLRDEYFFQKLSENENS